MLQTQREAHVEKKTHVTYQQLWGRGVEPGNTLQICVYLKYLYPSKVQGATSEKARLSSTSVMFVPLSALVETVPPATDHFSPHLTPPTSPPLEG